MLITNVIRLFANSPEGLIDLEDEYELDYLCGTVPNIGDKILSPWIQDKALRKHPIGRIVYELEQRYFLPEKHGEGLCYVALVIKKRPGDETEREVIS